MTTSTIESTQDNATWRTRATAILVAIATNIIILLGARLLNGAYPMAQAGGSEQTIGFGQVIFVTALTGLIAWGLLSGLERVTTRARTIWMVIATLVLLVSLLGPLGSGVDVASKMALACMHFGAALPIMLVMGRSATEG